MKTLKKWRKNAIMISSRLFSYDQYFHQGQMQTPAGDIIQVAEVTLIKSGEIVEHIQWCDEITYVVSGKATVYSGDTSFELTAGQIHFIKKGQYHKIVADENHNFHFYCIGFILNPNYLDLQSFISITESLDYFLIKDDGNIMTLFEQMMNELYVDDSETNSMIHFFFCQMFIYLYRNFKGKVNTTQNKISTSSSNYAVYRTLKYINREYIHITSVKQIANELSYSEYYLSHIFREKMDMTIKDYLMQKKIVTATALLSTSNMTISEIAEHLNFSSLHAFGKAFKRYIGTSASEFKRNVHHS